WTELIAANSAFFSRNSVRWERAVTADFISCTATHIRAGRSGESPAPDMHCGIRRGRLLAWTPDEFLSLAFTDLKDVVRIRPGLGNDVDMAAGINRYAG